MNTRKSQLTKSNQIHTSLSKFETNKLAQSCQSKRELSVKDSNSIKGNGLEKLCKQTKDATPRLNKGEVNRLAEAWCELLLRQLQEEKTQLSIERANFRNTGENINKNNLEMSKTYAVTR